jgi:hypothetical protein
MAITDTQKVDYLFKKIGFGAAKTDTSVVKSPSNEATASPLLLRGDIIWLESNQIPTNAPGATTDYVQVYLGTSAVECTEDSTATPNRTWLTGNVDWIPSEFGPSYQVSVYIDNTGAANPSVTGTKIFPDGSGNNDGWFFDYQSGVLNFADTNIPSQLTAGKSVFLEGYRYIGRKGVEQLSTDEQDAVYVQFKR